MGEMKGCRKAIGCLVISVFVLGGCTPAVSTSVNRQGPAAVQAPAAGNYGTADFVWVEPMVDVVDVPPGLDPEGIYWRPAHQEVVEIRQGRWRHYRQDKRERKDELDN